MGGGSTGLLSAVEEEGDETWISTMLFGRDQLQVGERGQGTWRGRRHSNVRAQESCRARRTERDLLASGWMQRERPRAHS